MKLKYLMIVILIIIAGCAMATREFGKPFDYAKANQVKIGDTDAEVSAMLGEPYQTKIMDNGEKAVAYRYSTNVALAGGTVAHGKTSIKKLVILYDKDGKVKAINKQGLND